MQTGSVQFGIGGRRYHLVVASILPAGLRLPTLDDNMAEGLLRRAFSAEATLATRVRGAFARFDGGRAGAPATLPHEFADRLASLVRRSVLRLVDLGPHTPLEALDRAAITLAPALLLVPERERIKMERIVLGLRDVPPNRYSGHALDMFRQMVEALKDPETIALVVAGLALWLASHFAIVGWAVDAVAAGVLYFTLKDAVWSWLARLGAFLKLAAAAETHAEIAYCSELLADLIVEIGITVMLAVLVHRAGRVLGCGTIVESSGRALPTASRAATARPGKHHTRAHLPNTTPPSVQCAQLKLALRDINLADHTYGKAPEPEPPIHLLSPMELSKLQINPKALDEGGFKAEIFQTSSNPSGYVVAFRGTRTGSLSEFSADMGQNVRQGIGMKSDYYEKAVSLSSKLNTIFGKNVSYTGHSLGGGLAAAAANASGQPATTFNAAGLHEQTVLSIHAGRVDNYIVDGEALTTLQQHTPMPSAAGVQHLLSACDPSTHTVAPVRSSAFHPLDSIDRHSTTWVRESLIEKRKALKCP